MHAIEPATALLSAWQSGDEILRLTADGLERLEDSAVVTRLPLAEIEAIYDVAAGSDVFDSDVEYSVIVAALGAPAVPAASVTGATGCPASRRAYSAGWSSFQTFHLRKMRSSVPSRIAPRSTSLMASLSGALPGARTPT